MNPWGGAPGCPSGYRAFGANHMLAARLQLPVACCIMRQQYLEANVEDVFHHYSNLLHELVAACRARL